MAYRQTVDFYAFKGKVEGAEMHRHAKIYTEKFMKHTQCNIYHKEGTEQTKQISFQFPFLHYIHKNINLHAYLYLSLLIICSPIPFVHERTECFVDFKRTTRYKMLYNYDNIQFFISRYIFISSTFVPKPLTTKSPISFMQNDYRLCRSQRHFIVK